MLQVRRVAWTAHEEERFDGILLPNILVGRKQYWVHDGRPVWRSCRAQAQVWTGVTRRVRSRVGRGLVGKQRRCVSCVGVPTGVAVVLGGLNRHRRGERMSGLDGGCGTPATPEPRVSPCRLVETRWELLRETGCRGRVVATPLRRIGELRAGRRRGSQVNRRVTRGRGAALRSERLDLVHSVCLPSMVDLDHCV
jgi:hypothetical protein